MAKLLETAHLQVLVIHMAYKVSIRYEISGLIVWREKSKVKWMITVKRLVDVKTSFKFDSLLRMRIPMPVYET